MIQQCAAHIVLRRLSQAVAAALLAITLAIIFWPEEAPRKAPPPEQRAACAEEAAPLPRQSPCRRAKQSRLEFAGPPRIAQHSVGFKQALLKFNFPVAVPSPGAVPSGEAKTILAAFDSAPFPYMGRVPRTNRPFLNVAESGRRGRRTPGGRLYWHDETYNDSRVLLHVPPQFDASQPGVIVVFFHGHGATLERDVRNRQQVPSQISESGVNAVLVAPQFAFDARDSSAGKFWRPNGFKRFLDEAAAKLAGLQGDPALTEKFAAMPVVLVAYSGGYLPAAWAISQGGVKPRIAGVMLLDALYGEMEKFAAWIANDRTGFFVSAYLNSTHNNNAALKKILVERDVTVSTQMGKPLRQGSVVIAPGGQGVTHRDLVTGAWRGNPIKDLLGKLEGYGPQ